MDHSQKYKGEHVELALFGGEYQDGVADGLLPARGCAPRRAQRAHPRAAAERGLIALHEPLRRARGGLAAAAACATRASSAQRGRWPASLYDRRRQSGAVASISVTVAVGPVASGAASSGMPRTCMHDRADHAAVRDAHDRRLAPAWRCHHARARRRAARSPSRAYVSPCDQPVPPATSAVTSG